MSVNVDDRHFGTPIERFCNEILSSDQCNPEMVDVDCCYFQVPSMLSAGKVGLQYQSAPRKMPHLLINISIQNSIQCAQTMLGPS